jgi:hypothetical protein
VNTAPEPAFFDVILPFRGWELIQRGLTVGGIY